MTDTNANLTSLKNTANQLIRQKQWRDAIRIYSQICQLDPADDQAWLMLGALNGQSGNIAGAENCCRQVIALKPDSIEAHINLGNVLQSRQRLDEALDSYRRALELGGDIGLLHFNTGVILLKLGRSTEAEACFRKAVALQPEHAGAWSSLAILLENRGCVEESQQCLETALAKGLEDETVLLHLGNVLARQYRVDEALQRYRQALQLNPGCIDAYINSGLALAMMGRFEEAVGFYESALNYQPRNIKTLASLIHCMQWTCRWDNYDRLVKRLDQLYREEGGDSTDREEPFDHITRCMDPLRNLQIAKAASQAIEQRVAGYGPNFSFSRHDKNRNRKIRIGYLSNDFHDHATAHLMAGLFRLHKHDDFEISAYAYDRDDGSEYRARIQRHCDHFIDIGGLGHEEAAKRIYADGTDILIDLKGHTGGARLEICALRPAPVQITYLGFPGTSGAGFFDYIIADRIVVPEEHLPFYSEQIVYMPHSYQVNDNHQVISEDHYDRARFSLPDSAVVFCSFNQAYKIDPVMFDVWMNILIDIPDSVLWLLCGNGAAENNLKKAAEKRAVNPRRLIFAERLPKAQHLARLRLADIVLDTRIYNGHTTTSDALWAGVPVITLCGSHFASRVSASLLEAIQLPELITNSPDAYRSLAVRLGSDVTELSAVRRKLAQHRLTSALFNTAQFTADFETALRHIWKLYTTTGKARSFAVDQLREGI